MDQREFIERLNQLLEAERAGVEVMDLLAKEEDDEKVREKFVDVKKDEGRYCAGLYGMIKDRGENPSEKTGDFVAKVLALADRRDRLALLVKGQEWVLRKVRDIPGELLSPADKEFVRDMIEGHEINIAYVQSLIK